VRTQMLMGRKVRHIWTFRPINIGAPRETHERRADPGGRSTSLGIFVT
jgi:hypothetical protein